MTLAVNASGSQLTVLTTEHQLANPSAAGIYVFDVDCGVMLNADILEIRVKKPLLSAGTLRVVWRATVGPAARSETIVTSPPVLCPFGCTVTIKQVAGTVRTYPWSLMTL